MAEQQIIDSLGKILTVEMEQADLLKALAAAMGASVNKEGGPVVEELKDIEKKEEGRHKSIIDLTKKLPEEIFSKFKKPFEEATKLLQDIAKGKGGGGGGSGGGTSGGNSFGSDGIKKQLNAIRLNTLSIKEIAKSGGILEQINNSVRSVAAQVKALRKNMDGSGGGRGFNSGSTKTTKTPKKSEDQLLNLPGALGPEENATESIKKFNRLWYVIQNVNSEMEILLNSEKIADNVADKIGIKYQQIENTLYDISQNERIIGRRKMGLIKNELDILKQVTAEYNRTGEGLEKVEEQQKKVLATARQIQAASKRWSLFEAVADFALLANFGKRVSNIMGGIVEDMNFWEIEASRMASTMEGASGAVKENGRSVSKATKEYREMFKVSDDIVENTHQFGRVIRKEWVKQIKKGTRLVNETKEAVNSAYAAAWQVGSSAEATADEFQKWNMELGMTSSGSKSLARTMQTVAKQTGVMGDHILQAVEASREIAQLMKDTGLYSQEVANSIVGWTASAQKFGVAKQMQDLFKASQGGLEAFTNASMETRNLLASAGQVQNILSGTATPDSIAKGTEEALKKAIIQGGGRGAFETDAEGKAVGLPDLKKLDKAQLSRLDLIMKKRFGMKLGESVHLLEAIRAQDPEKGLEDINRQLGDKSRMTRAEIESLELQKKQLEAALEDKKLNKMLDQFGSLSEKAKASNKSLDDLLKEMKINKSELIANTQKSTEKIAAKLKEGGKDFEQVMGMSQSKFTKEFQDSLMKNDKTKFRELNEKLAEANKTADSSAKNNSNLSDKKETQDQILNNKITNALKPLHTLVMQSPLWLFNLVTISGGIWALYRLWSQGGAYQAIAGTFKTLKETLGTKGSGWVHDPYVEKVNVGMAKNIALIAKKQGVSGTHSTKRLKDKTDSKIGGGVGVGIDAKAGSMGGLGGLGKSVGLLAALTPILMGIGLALSMIMGLFSAEELSAIFKPLIDIWNELKKTLKDGLTNLLKSLVAIITPIVKALLPIFVNVLKVLFGVLDLLMTVLNPIFMIFSAIFEVLSKIINAVLKPFMMIWKAISGVITKLFKVMGAVILPVLKAIATVIDVLLTPLEWLCDLLDFIFTPFEKLGESLDFLSGPLKLVSDIFSALLAPFKWLWNILKEIFGVVKSLLMPVFNAFKSVISAIGKPLGWAVDVLGNIFSFNFSGLWDNFKSAMSGIYDTAKSVFSSIGGWLSDIGDTVGSWFSDAADFVGDTVGDLWDGATSLISDAGKSIGDSLRAGADAIGLGSVADALSNVFDIFHAGGMVPGGPNQEVPILAQAGEAVLTTGQQGFISESLSSLVGTIQNMTGQMNELRQPTSLWDWGTSLVDKLFPSMGSITGRDDLDSQVQSKVQSSAPSAAMEAATSYLSQIAANTAATVTELENAVEALEDIRDRMDSEAGTGTTKPRSKPRSTPNFFQWAFGRFSDTSAKQHVNPGF